MTEINGLGPRRVMAPAGVVGAGGAGRVSSFSKLSLFDIGRKIAGKRVLVRCDFNGTAKGGKIKSEDRILAAKETIAFLIGHGAAQVILMSHNGRNEEIAKDPAAFTLVPVAAKLSEILGVQVDFVTGFDKPVTSTAAVVLMENTRADARDEAGDIGYAREIISATNPDIYVLDGFSVAHRDQASVTLPARLMQAAGKQSAAGILMLREYEFFIDRVIERPEQPFVVFLGGSKVGGKNGKLPILNAFLPNLEQVSVVVGGAMAFPFLLAKGYAVKSMDPFAGKDGRALELEAEVKLADNMIKGPHGHKIIVPTLAVGADRLQIDVAKDPVPEGFVMRDLRITGVIDRLEQIGARTIFFNGTFGAYEAEHGAHVEGTHEVFLFMGEQTGKGAITVPGGGDTCDVLKGFAKTDYGKNVRFTHQTLGGGASGKLIVLGLEGKATELPGFACLTDKA